MTKEQFAHEATLKFMELHFNLVKENRDSCKTERYSCYEFNDYVNLYLITNENILKGLNEPGFLMPCSYPELD